MTVQQTAPDMDLVVGPQNSNSGEFATLGDGSHVFAYADDTGGGSLQTYLAHFEGTTFLETPIKITTLGGVVPQLAWAGALGVTLRESLGPDVFFYELDQDLVQLGPRVSVTQTQSAYSGPTISGHGDVFGIVWLETTMTRASYTLRHRDGTVIVPPTLLGTGMTTGDKPSIAGTGSTWLIAFKGTGGRAQDDVLYTVVDDAGTTIAPIASLTDATAATAGDAHSPSVIATPAGYVAAWIDTRDGDVAVYMTELSPSGVRTRTVSRVSPSGSSAIPTLATGPAGIAIAWLDGKVTQAGWYTPAGVVSVPLSSSATANTAGIGLAVGSADASIVWTDTRDGSNDLRITTIGCP